MSVEPVIVNYDQEASESALARIFGSDEQAPAAIISMFEGLNDVMGKSLSESTKRAYRNDWARFEAWCSEVGAIPMPALGAVVAGYLYASAQETKTDARGKKVAAYSTATLRRWLASINQVHARAGMPKPISDERVPIVMKGIARELGSRQKRATPLHRDDIYEIVEKLDPHQWPHGTQDTRDAALLTLGYVGAFRRSELCNLQMRDIAIERVDGLHVTIRKSKADQEGQGQVKAIPYGRRGPATCPVCAVLRWIAMVDASDRAREKGYRGSRPGDVLPPGSEAAKKATMRHTLHRAPSWDTHICRDEEFGSPDPDDDRPLFRRISNLGLIYTGTLSGHSAGRIVKDRVEQIGLRPERYSGHSLRAGFITDAYRHGADDSAIRRQTGHASPAMLEIYRREHNPILGNAVTSIGF